MKNKIKRFIARRRLRPFLLGGMVLAIITQIVALSPVPLEDVRTAPAALDPASLIENEEVTLATDIPKGQIPEYTVDEFDFVSTREGVKQWQLLSRHAYLYNAKRLVHARQVKAFLFDSTDKVTVVIGKEAKYFMNERDLEIFGDVETVFSDGFRLSSQYLRYRPREQKIEIPANYPVKGEGEESPGQRIRFESMGFDFHMGRAQIRLPAAVKLTFHRSDAKDGPTTIESDYCMIDRKQRLAKFTMSARRSADTRFVKISQPTINARARFADLQYGQSATLLQYMVAHEDVVIRELGNKDSFRYATAGRADFDSRQDVIVLSQFPQVYQDSDTVIGEVIKLYRDSDIIEVEQSNSFSQGQTQ